MEKSRTGRPIRQRAKDVKDSLSLRLSPPDWSQVITDELPFGGDAADAFVSDLSRCRSYLEFGSGASTLVASRVGCPLVTVESDARFLSSMEGRCRATDRPDGAGTMTFVHGDIGMTGAWGMPIMQLVPSPKRWAGYPMAAWIAMGRDYRADLVLVDGRFRVASALAVAIMQLDEEWTILFDDYADRQEYWAIEQFTELAEMRGRMAVLRPSARVDAAELRGAFDHYVRDWR